MKSKKCRNEEVHEKKGGTAEQEEEDLQGGGQTTPAPSQVATKQSSPCIGRVQAPVEKVHPVKLPSQTPA